METKQRHEFIKEFRHFVALGKSDFHVRIRPDGTGPKYLPTIIYTIFKQLFHSHFLAILSKNHLYRILKDYTDYYNNCRTHLSLKKNSPEPRNVEKPEKGRVVSIPKVSGLHHLYKRVA